MSDKRLICKIPIEEFRKDKDLKIAWKAFLRRHFNLADYAIKRYLKNEVIKMKEISKRNAERLGAQTMLFQTMEECGELIKAISKYNRVNGIGQKTEMLRRDARLNLIKEIADVEICIEQLKYLLGVEPLVEQAKDVAYNKVAERYGD